MYHNIEFSETVSLTLETSPKDPLERILVKKGMRMKAQVKARVVETRKGPVEMADLFFEDGIASRAIRYASFAFVDARAE